jgi:hypothetical protein
MLGEEHLRFSSTRFSVISKRQLEMIHQLFTPEELVYVHLILNNPESQLSYTLAGRAINLEKKLPNKIFLSNFTSSCLIGFVVNMVQRSVSLVTPRTTDTGMNVLETLAFADEVSYENTLRMLITKWMKSEIPLDKKMCNNNIKYERDGDYLVIWGDKIHRRVSVSEKEYQALVLVLEGQTLEEVFNGAHFTEYERKCVAEFIQLIYDNGYIDID